MLCKLQWTKYLVKSSIIKIETVNKATTNTEKLLSDVEPMEVIKFMLGDIPIKGHYTHSYGFHTANGRSLIEGMKNVYYEEVQFYVD